MLARRTQPLLAVDVFYVCSRDRRMALADSWANLLFQAMEKHFLFAATAGS